MDVKWLIIVFLGILGVFRAANPLGIKHWSSLKFREFEGSGGFGKTLFSLILFAIFSLMIALTVDLDLNPWLCLGAILVLLLFRIAGILLLSVLFSQRIGIPKLHLTQGFLVASFTYAAIAVGILINLVVFRGSNVTSLYHSYWPCIRIVLPCTRQARLYKISTISGVVFIRFCTFARSN